MAAVHELSFAVSGITVSEMLPRTSELIFVNVTTLEGPPSHLHTCSCVLSPCAHSPGQAYCLELTGKGWRVTSLRHDCMNGDINNIDLHTRYYESPYALMDTISPGYRAKFSEALSYKLSQLSSSMPQTLVSPPPPPPLPPYRPLPPPSPFQKAGSVGAPGPSSVAASADAPEKDAATNTSSANLLETTASDPGLLGQETTPEPESGSDPSLLASPVTVAVRHPSGEATHAFPDHPNSPRR